MVGRNDPCPCGSGKEYKKCCETVVEFQLAEQARESREKEIQNELLEDLNQWFHHYRNVEQEDIWMNRFKGLLGLPLDQPIPEKITSLFHHWLLFDSPCMENKRPIDLWLSTIRKTADKERVLKNLSSALFTCYEIKAILDDHMIFQSLVDGTSYEVRKGSFIPKKELVFTRLIRLGNHYELFGPYTSFVHEMRGEILVQLEKYNHYQDEQEELTPEESGWKVLGLSIQRAKELEDIEKVVSSSTTMLDNLFWTTETEAKEPASLPVKIVQELEQFYITEVFPLQKNTQAFYSRSLDQLFHYLSTRFGQEFTWEKVNGDVLAHYLSVWYLDHSKNTPVAAKVHLNICKHLFRWLSQEGIYDQFASFRKVYQSLIRTLPITIEARKWIMEYGVYPAKKEAQQVSKSLFMLTTTQSGPVLLVGNQWKSVYLRSFPTIWSGHRFWIRGVVEQEATQYRMIQVDNVYPVIDYPESLNTQNRVLGQQ